MSIVGPTNDLIRGPPVEACQSWPSLSPREQGDTWLVTSPESPQSLERALRNSLLCHHDPREQYSDGGGREWTFMRITRKIPAHVIVA